MSDSTFLASFTPINEPRKILVVDGLRVNIGEGKKIAFPGRRLLLVNHEDGDNWICQVFQFNGDESIPYVVEVPKSSPEAQLVECSFVDLVNMINQMNADIAECKIAGATSLGLPS